ncbi:putative T7 phage protein [Candidatus Rickettsiella viridis]|uniref:Putative T7 phage protein n=1 Tax=Candidatus Rickettsiella viridis TaxID=676208 RepID=A0A2Z5UTC8_9COXI|nr:hypothetical protein [Candidatus Rickettsiella viridis]BBB14688.1 putative T7 phage protein [Candidatus Rickettsiella viridis]
MNFHYPQINNSKKPRDGINLSNYLYTNQINTPFGNLSLKYLHVIMRVDWINVKIKSLFDSFYQTRQGFSGISTSGFEELEHQLITEELMYWLRKIADELISLTYIQYTDPTGLTINKLKFDRIGAILQEPSHSFSQFFKDHLPILEKLNEVSNIYKHSFINTAHGQISELEPTIIAFNLKRNDLKNAPEYYTQTLRIFIENYNKFYIDITARLKNNTYSNYQIR